MVDSQKLASLNYIKRLKSGGSCSVSVILNAESMRQLVTLDSNKTRAIKQAIESAYNQLTNEATK